jgi:toxin ParE1/3/4
MRLIIRDEAARDLDDILDWISQENPSAAVAVVRRIRNKLDLLLHPELAQMGRPGRDEGTRELIEHPYIIVYEANEEAEEVIVLAVLHGARNRDRIRPRR